jgi:hypothetical protein
MESKEFQICTTSSKKTKNKDKNSKEEELINKIISEEHFETHISAFELINHFSKY